MTAPRTCRVCGQPLTGDVRWCLRCYEPSRELTPRAAVWQPGEFVDNPVHAGGPIPHWSRWEGSSTTFGPLGRIVATALFLLTIPLAASVGAFLYLLFLPVTAYALLPAIWAKGYVIPGAEAPAPPARRIERPGAHPVPPMTKPMLMWRGTWISIVFVGCLLFAYAPSVEVKTIVLAAGVLTGLFFFWRGYLSR